MTSGHKSKSTVNHPELLPAICQSRWLAHISKGRHLASGYKFISNHMQWKGRLVFVMDIMAAIKALLYALLFGLSSVTRKPPYSSSSC